MAVVAVAGVEVVATGTAVAGMAAVVAAAGELDPR